ncbi:MAG: kelch-like protein [Acidobacteria bacterium]|nr:kelch-like protein [Acidobacteriota bacterium]
MYRVVLLLSAAIIATLPVYSQPQAQLGRWGMRTPLLEPFSEHAVAELDGKIYVIAGNTNDRGTVATILVYDSANDSWTHTTPLPVAVNHNMAATMNGKLYVFGGQTATQGDSPFVDTVYEFNPATEQLTERAPMSLARSAGATAVVNGKIYVAGGRPPRGHDFAVYDPVANTWGRLPDLPTQRNHLAVAAINGKVYVAGGRFGPGSTSDVTDILEIFDPETNQWSEGARMPIPRGGINGIVANGCLHIFGGEGNRNDPSGMFSNHDVYNPVTNSWTQLPAMPIPVHGVTGGGFLNGLIYLPGGATGRGGRGRSNLLQVYRPATTCR